MGKRWESVGKTGENFERKLKEMREVKGEDRRNRDGYWMLRTTINMHNHGACLVARVGFGSSADR